MFMLEENKTVELTEEELEKVAGGSGELYGQVLGPGDVGKWYKSSNYPMQILRLIKGYNSSESDTPLFTKYWYNMSKTRNNGNVTDRTSCFEECEAPPSVDDRYSEENPFSLISFYEQA